MEKLKAALNKDVKEYNLKLLIISGVLFITLMGFISYKLTNKSYALFSDTVTGTKTLTLHYESPKIVTFDPDGGIIPVGTDWTGSGNSATKEVTKGVKYGELPIPTKEGYTFKGWNGKNLFDISAIENDTSKSKVNVIDDSKVFFDGSTVENNNSSSINIQRYLNGSYVNLLCSFPLSIKRHSCTFEKDSSFDLLLMKENTSKSDPYFFVRNLSLINGNNYTLSFNLESYDSSKAQSLISNIQLEESSTATEYEPYFVTEDTKVVQNSNHTLKAIWEEEEETQTEP